MKIAYFDCFSGASGNMILGSLVDAGLPQDVLEHELRKLPVLGWQLRAARVRKRGLAALYLDVHVPGEDGHPAHPHPDGHDHAHASDHHHEGIAHRTLSDVLQILAAAKLPSRVEQTAALIYRNLAKAEGRAHGEPPESVVFHEVGQVDAIIDIAGAALGLDLLGVEAVYCSALPCGKGRITSAHGIGPSPAPATLELLRGKPTYTLEVEGEFVTPTGAAILASIASFAPRPAMTIDSIGYGSGSSDFPFPNVLRVLIGETTQQAPDEAESDDVVVLETNIDDMNPQLYEHVLERLFAAGALDVWTSGATMKKGRPAVILSALAPPQRATALAAVMLAETTSIGVRHWVAHRVTLPRRMETFETSLGPVRVKIIERPAGRRARPEFDDVRAIAQRDGLALTDTMAIVEREVAERLERG